MTDVKKFNGQSLGEEIGNAITHGVGAVLAALATAAIVLYNKAQDKKAKK